MLLRQLVFDQDIPGIDVHDAKQFRLPAPATTGWVFEDSKLQQQYWLRGQWHAASFELYLADECLNTREFVKKWCEMPLAAQRMAVDKMMVAVGLDPVNQWWLRQ